MKLLVSQSFKNNTKLVYCDAQLDRSISWKLENGEVVPKKEIKIETANVLNSIYNALDN